MTHRPTANISKELYPFQSHYLSIAGINITTWKRVKEIRLLCCTAIRPGPSTTANSSKSCPLIITVWHQTISAWAFRISPVDADYEYTFPQRVQDLEEFLAAKGITENITLIMHDWGGPIGMSFARNHPEAIKKIVLLNTAAFHLPESKPFPGLLRLARTLFAHSSCEPLMPSALLQL